MIDVYEALWGPDRNAKLRAAVTSGRCVVKVRCPCGHTIAKVYVHESKAWLVTSGTRTTRPETADNVIESALRDIETLARLEDEYGESRDIDQAATIISNFLEAGGETLKAQVSKVVSATKFPGQVVCIEGLPQARAEALRASRETGTVPNRFAAMSPTCPGCRAVWYLGDDLADWMEIATSSRSSKIVASTRTEPFYVSHRTAIDYDDARLETLGRRVVLYARITGVLKSKHTAR